MLGIEGFLLREEGNQQGGHVKYVLEPFSELREPILTSSTSKWPARRVLLRKLNEKIWYQIFMLRKFEKLIFQTKKRTVANVEFREFRHQKSTIIDYNMTPHRILFFQLIKSTRTKNQRDPTKIEMDRPIQTICFQKPRLWFAYAPTAHSATSTKIVDNVFSGTLI